MLTRLIGQTLSVFMVTERVSPPLIYLADHPERLQLCHYQHHNTDILQPWA